MRLKIIRITGHRTNTQHAPAPGLHPVAAGGPGAPNQIRTVTFNHTDSARTRARVRTVLCVVNYLSKPGKVAAGAGAGPERVTSVRACERGAIPTRIVNFYARWSRRHHRRRRRRRSNDETVYHVSGNRGAPKLQLRQCARALSPAFGEHTHT